MSRRISRKIKLKSTSEQSSESKNILSGPSRGDRIEKARLYLKKTFHKTIYSEIESKGTFLAGALAGPVTRKLKRK